MQTDALLEESNQKMITNRHPHCQPVTEASVDVLHVDRTMRSEIKKSGKRPRDAYMETVASIPKRFRSSEMQEEIIKSFPTFTNIKKALYRHRDATHVSVPYPFKIPQKLHTTLRDKDVFQDDANYNERFLLYNGQNEHLLIFCADTELSRLYHSDYIVGNGTFEMTPQSSYQLYTLHFATCTMCSDFLTRSRRYLNGPVNQICHSHSQPSGQCTLITPYGS